MKRTLLALLLALSAGAALADDWNVATTSDPVWRSQFDFVSPAP